MRGKKNPDKQQPTPQLPPCKVCGVQATGFHYGVTTCGACKGFFRRTLTRHEPYSCIGSGNCPIGPETDRRKSCPRCRHDKCMAVGMSKNSIKTGRYSYEKKSKDVLEMLEVRAKLAGSPSSSPESRSRSKLSSGQGHARLSSSPYHNASKSGGSVPHYHCVKGGLLSKLQGGRSLGTDKVASNSSSPPCFRTGDLVSERMNTLNGCGDEGGFVGPNSSEDHWLGEECDNCFEASGGSNPSSLNSIDKDNNVQSSFSSSTSSAFLSQSASEARYVENQRGDRKGKISLSQSYGGDLPLPCMSYTYVSDDLKKALKKKLKFQKKSEDVCVCVEGGTNKPTSHNTIKAADPPKVLVESSKDSQYCEINSTQNLDNQIVPEHYSVILDNVQHWSPDSFTVPGSVQQSYNVQNPYNNTPPLSGDSLPDELIESVFPLIEDTDLLSKTLNNSIFNIDESDPLLLSKTLNNPILNIEDSSSIVSDNSSSCKRSIHQLQSSDRTSSPYSTNGSIASPRQTTCISSAAFSSHNTSPNHIPQWGFSSAHNSHHTSPNHTPVDFATTTENLVYGSNIFSTEGQQIHSSNSSSLPDPNQPPYHNPLDQHSNTFSPVHTTTNHTQEGETSNDYHFTNFDVYSQATPTASLPSFQSLCQDNDNDDNRFITNNCKFPRLSEDIIAQCEPRRTAVSPTFCALADDEEDHDGNDLLENFSPTITATTCLFTNHQSYSQGSIGSQDQVASSRPKALPSPYLDQFRATVYDKVNNDELVELAESLSKCNLVSYEQTLLDPIFNTLNISRPRTDLTQGEGQEVKKDERSSSDVNDWKFTDVAPQPKKIISGSYMLYHKPLPWCEFSEAHLDDVTCALMAAHEEHIGKDLNSVSEEELEQKTEVYMKVCKLKEKIFGKNTMIEDCDHYFQILDTTGIDLDGRQKYAEIQAKLTNVVLFKMVRFIKAVPGFRDVNAEDKITLSRVSMPNLFWLGSFRGYRKDCGVWLDENNCAENFEEMNGLCPDYAAHMPFLLAVTDRCQKLNLNLEEIVLLKAISCVSPETDGIIDQPALDILCWRFHCCLLLSLYRRCEKPDMVYSKIITMLCDLKIMAKIHFEAMDLTSDFGKLTSGVDAPLYKEMFLVKKEAPH